MQKYPSISNQNQRQKTSTHNKQSFFFKPGIQSGLTVNQSFFKAATPVIQMQTDPMPSKNILEERENAGLAAILMGTGRSEEIGDFGQGVGSIEAGMPALMPVEHEEKEEETFPVQSKSADPSTGNPKFISSQSVLGSLDNGFPMNQGLQNRMEGFFGENFSSVKLHTGSQANTLATSLGAYAFTVGDNIAFSEGKFQPSTPEGEKLLAHELTHVVQQRQGVSGRILKNRIGQPGDLYELEADRKANEFSNHAHTRPLINYVSGATSSSNSDQAVFRSPVIQLYSGSAAAAYASKWAKATNSAYGRFGNDCTNFVSQAMEAGGWTMISGSSYCDDRKKNSVWWYRSGACVYGVCPWDFCPDVKSINASYTWGGAQNFFNFMNTSGRGTAVSKVSDMNIGDVLQMDIGGGGHIGHTMIVTKKTADNLYLSYHTSDHLDEPFWPDGTNPGILARNPNPPNIYYGWSVK